MTPGEKEYISKDAVMTEIERRITACDIFWTIASRRGDCERAREEVRREKSHYESLLLFVKELEVKKL